LGIGYKGRDADLPGLVELAPSRMGDVQACGGQAASETEHLAASRWTDGRVKDPQLGRPTDVSLSAPGYNHLCAVFGGWRGSLRDPNVPD
jgi:hypothetical protein